MQEKRRLSYVLSFFHINECSRTTFTVGAVVKMFPNDKVKIDGTPKKYTVTHGTTSGKTAYRFFCADCGTPTHAQGEIVPGMSAVRLALFEGPMPAPAGEGFWKYASGKPVYSTWRWQTSFNGANTEWEKMVAPEEHVKHEV